MKHNSQHDKRVYLTAEGLHDLKAEYEKLTREDRPKVADRIARAREFGDLSENAEYDAAREQQSFIEGRIIELEEILKHAQVIENRKSKVNIVEVGSTVTVEIDGEKENYTIVGSVEAQPEQGRISHESPVGKALLGLKVGDEVDVDLPHAKLKYRIIQIHSGASN
ncbi:MAG TPA: transcription elongation factor GreA [Patescibacteria group bacterium]|nr:transcription elongation factor GreA [Patescibacteria group bacterium]